MSDELTQQQRELLHRLFDSPDAPDLHDFGSNLQSALGVIASAALHIRDITEEPGPDPADDARTIAMMLDMILETSMEWHVVAREMSTIHQRHMDEID